MTLLYGMLAFPTRADRLTDTGATLYHSLRADLSATKSKPPRVKPSSEWRLRLQSVPTSCVVRRPLSSAQSLRYTSLTLYAQRLFGLRRIRSLVRLAGVVWHGLELPELPQSRGRDKGFDEACWVHFPLANWMRDHFEIDLPTKGFRNCRRRRSRRPSAVMVGRS